GSCVCARRAMQSIKPLRQRDLRPGFNAGGPLGCHPRLTCPRTAPPSRHKPPRFRTFGFGTDSWTPSPNPRHSAWHPVCFALSGRGSAGLPPGSPLDHSRRLTMYRHCTLLVLVGSLLAAVGGCHGQPGQVAPPQPPAVPVSQPVQQEVTDYVDFTG